MPAIRRSVIHHATAARTTSVPMIASRQASSIGAGEDTRASPACASRRPPEERLSATGLSRPRERRRERRLAAAAEPEPEGAYARRVACLGDGDRRVRRMEDVGELGRLAGLRAEGDDVVDFDLAI